MSGKKRRKLVTPYGEFEWMYHGGPVTIWGPDGFKAKPLCRAVTGRTQHTHERGQWKKTSDGYVTPGMVRKWLDENYPR